MDAAIGLWNVAFVVVKKGTVIDGESETEDDTTKPNDADGTNVTISSKRNESKSKKQSQDEWVTKSDSKPKDVLNKKDALKLKDTTGGNTSDKTDTTDGDDGDTTVEPKWQNKAPLLLIANPWNKGEST